MKGFGSRATSAAVGRGIGYFDSTGHVPDFEVGNCFGDMGESMRSCACGRVSLKRKTLALLKKSTHAGPYIVAHPILHDLGCKVNRSTSASHGAKMLE